MRRLNVGALRSPSLSAEFPVSLVPKRMKKKTKKEEKEEEEKNKKVFPRVFTNVKISTLDVCPFICPSVIVQSRESSKEGKSAITDRGFHAPHTRQTYDFTQFVSSYLILSRLAFKKYSFRIDISCSLAALRDVSQTGERKKKNE